MLTSRRLYNFYNTQSNDGLPRPQIFTLNQHNPADSYAFSPLKPSAGEKESAHSVNSVAESTDWTSIHRSHHHHRLQRRISILLYFNISVYLIKHIYIWKPKKKELFQKKKYSNCLALRVFLYLYNNKTIDYDFINWIVKLQRILNNIVIISSASFCNLLQSFCQMRQNHNKRNCIQRYSFFVNLFTNLFKIDFIYIHLSRVHCAWKCESESLTYPMDKAYRAIKWQYLKVLYVNKLYEWVRCLAAMIDNISINFSTYEQNDF